LDLLLQFTRENPDPFGQGTCAQLVPGQTILQSESIIRIC
jgi:hypothetical protein